jgi:hypothetical protein
MLAAGFIAVASLIFISLDLLNLELVEDGNRTSANNVYWIYIKGCRAFFNDLQQATKKFLSWWCLQLTQILFNT